MADQALSTPPGTPPPPSSTSATNSMSSSFDIISYYNHLLKTDGNITPPIAAIESLITLLSKSSLQTVSETLSLLSAASSTLLASCSNPLPVSAGTDLFQRYLITSFNQTPLSSQSGSDFTALRNQLITNSKLFVARTKQARTKIAHHALHLFGPENDPEFQTTVITYGSSRVVDEILRHAVDKGRWFNVIYILPATSFSVSSPTTSSAEVTAVNPSLARIRKSIDLLRSLNKDIPLSTVPLSSLPLVLNTLPSHPETRTASSTIFLLGTVAVLENGALVSELGSSLVASVAKTAGVPVYIASESYKFARQFPLGSGEAELRRMGVRQDIFSFASASAWSASSSVTATTTTGGGAGDSAAVAASTTTKDKPKTPKGSSGKAPRSKEDELVDITPPELIGGMVTENGMMTPNAVAEELIKLWF